MNDAEASRPVVRGVGSTKRGFADLEGAFERFEQEEEIIFELGVGELEERKERLKRTCDFPERGDL